MNAAETHETIHRESGMRYQHSLIGPIDAWIGPFRCLLTAALFRIWSSSAPTAVTNAASDS